MKIKNCIKKVTRNISMNSNLEQKELKKEKYFGIYSRYNNNKNNHVLYISNSSNEVKLDIKKNNKFTYYPRNEQKDELDHPKPLITEYEDELVDLKSEFKPNENIGNKIIKDKDNIEKTKDSSEGQDSIYDDKHIKNGTYKNSDIDTEVKSNNKIEKNCNKNYNNSVNLDNENKEKNMIKIISSYVNKETKINSFIHSNYEDNNNEFSTIFDKKNNKIIGENKYNNINKENHNNNEKQENENIDFINIKNNSFIKNKNYKNNNELSHSKIFKSETLFKEYNNKISNKNINNYGQNCSKKNIRLKKAINNTKIIYKKLNLELNDKTKKNKIEKTNNDTTRIKNNKEPHNKENIKKYISIKKIPTKVLFLEKIPNMKKNIANISSNYNNTKTTYIVCSKNQRIKKSYKGNLSPKVTKISNKISNNKISNESLNQENNVKSRQFTNKNISFTYKERKGDINKGQLRLLFFNNNKKKYFH